LSSVVFGKGGSNASGDEIKGVVSDYREAPHLNI
jgi:hypothetical protein